jgi:hypothetical protein
MRAALIALVAVAGCVHLDGALQVDGAPFVARACRSGTVFGFAGVQLMDERGRRLRAVSDPLSGEVSVALFDSGQSRGRVFRGCATLTQRPQGFTVNGVQGQRGTAALDCRADGHTVNGTIDFANCH